MGKNWYILGWNDGFHRNPPRRDAIDQPSYDIGYLQGSDRRHELEDTHVEQERA